MLSILPISAKQRVFALHTSLSLVCLAVLKALAAMPVVWRMRAIVAPSPAVLKRHHSP